MKCIKSNGMKNGLLSKQFFLKTIVLISCLMVVMLYNKSKAQSNIVITGKTLAPVTIKM